MPRRENGDADESREESTDKEIIDKQVNSDEEDGEDDPPSGDGLSEEVYEVESIITHMYKRGDLFFKVRWKNYSEEYDTVEPASNLTSASLAIQEYWKNSNSTQTPGKSAKSKISTPSSKGKNDKKTSAKSAKTESASNSRSRRAERKTTPTEPEPSGNEEAPSDKEEDGYYDGAEETAQSSRKKRPVSKGALKAYESSKVSAAPSAMSTPKQIAIKARSGWLFDESDESDAEESATKTEVVAPKQTVKRNADEAIVVPPPAKKAAKQSVVVKEKENGSVEQSATLIGVFNQNGICKMVIADDGDEKLISLKDAHDRFGFTLVNYLADKVIGKV